MSNINAGIRNFEHMSGQILFGSGSPVNILNVEAGSVEWEPGLREPKPFKDRGVLQAPMAGDQRPSKLKFNVKYTSAYTSTELYQLLAGASITDGLTPTFVVAVVIQDPTASTKETITFNSCYLMQAPKIKTGDKFDTLQVEFEDAEPAPTITHG